MLNPETVRYALRGIAYPAFKEDLIQYAKASESSEEVLSLLNQLPGRMYMSTDEVIEEIDRLGLL